MVRAIDSALLNALNASSRCPSLTLTIEDHVIHYATYQSPGTADAWNDVCIAADNSIVRVQVTRGGTGFATNFQVQRITDPTQVVQWTNWTSLPGAAGLMFQDGGCALSNSAGVLRAFAQRGTGGSDLWVWASADNGVTWSGPVSVLVPPGGGLLKGIGSAGNNDVFFLYDVSGGEAVGVSFYASGSWSALTSWTLPTITYGMGLAPVWTGTTYTIVYSDGYTLFSCVYNPSTHVWSSSSVIAPSTIAAIGRVAPRISFADGLYTLTCIESDSGAMTGTIYSYPRLRQSADLVHWSNGVIVPDMTVGYGASAFKLMTPVSGTAGARYYLISMAVIFSALAFQTTNSSQFLNVSASVLSYQRHEQVGKTAHLEVVLDNANGVYDSYIATGSLYAPFALNATLVLSEGYLAGSPPTISDSVKTGMYHIALLQCVRTPDTNCLHILALDLSRNLDSVSRYQITWTNQTVSYLVAEICARAGLFGMQLPTTAQMSELITAFVLQAGQTYRHALDELCSIYALEYFLDQNEVMQFRELAGSDPSVWGYQPEIEMVTFGSEDQRANHVIVNGKPPAGGMIGALTSAETYDAPHMHLVGLERILYHVDQKLQTTTQCSQKAAFLLAQQQRLQVKHCVTVPLNPALQLLDGITLTDSVAPTGSGQQAMCRIVQSKVAFDAQKGLNEQQLLLEGL